VVQSAAAAPFFWAPGIGENPFTAVCQELASNLRSTRGERAQGLDPGKRSVCMLWTIFVILLILWILGFSFHVAGSLIHLLLVIAVVVLIIQLITGRRVV
jgi:hypothetical protein